MFSYVYRHKKIRGWENQVNNEKNLTTTYQHFKKWNKLFVAILSLLIGSIYIALF